MTTTSPPTLAQIRKRDEQTTSLSDIAVLHDRRELLRLLDESHAQIDGLMKRLTAEAARLDWLTSDSTRDQALRVQGNSNRGYAVYDMADGLVCIGKGKTPREAIDSAMASQGGGDG